MDLAPTGPSVRPSGASMPLTRREFCRAAVIAAAAPLSALAAPLPAPDASWRAAWDKAISAVSGNVRTLPGYARQLLIEGSSYNGVWLECGPHEGLVYAQLAKFFPKASTSPLDVARNNHMAFFAMQRADGQLPCDIKLNKSGEAQVFFSQLQMVVPIAATALELAHLTGDESFLAAAYDACSRWDAWLRKVRNTRGTGLTEGFCTYDTGHDNSPRWRGLPNNCPGGEARNIPSDKSLPRLCPDLSATVYGGRVALSAMAAALGKKAEANHWLDDSESIRHLILTRLYSPEDAAFYDLDAQDNFVRVRSDVISRVLGEHVLHLDDRHDRRIFDAVWSRQLHNSAAFWSPFPFPSIAQDDPAFVRPIPRNSWGGASQALTALRTLRWMEHFGKHVEQSHLMRQWCAAIARQQQFSQQLDPVTGDYAQPDPGAYTPAALVFLSFAQHLGAAPSALV